MPKAAKPPMTRKATAAPKTPKTPKAKAAPKEPKDIGTTPPPGTEFVFLEGKPDPFPIPTAYVADAKAVAAEYRKEKNASDSRPLVSFPSGPELTHSASSTSSRL